ncbi:hypothetical protein [Haladaptatus litoreus]|uniref:hypothetical protein n=1 Tax=Haladaptatus litoreus TaxID=553468 RepID=UPI001FEB1F9D|nr:hypothetical protein [Haladaptatus litoreus]
MDVTDDGNRIWFVGGSGVIGEYDVETETLTNYSAPKGKTSTWEDLQSLETAARTNDSTSSTVPANYSSASARAVAR